MGVYLFEVEIKKEEIKFGLKDGEIKRYYIIYYEEFFLIFSVFYSRMGFLELCVGIIVDVLLLEFINTSWIDLLGKNLDLIGFNFF